MSAERDCFAGSGRAETASRIGRRQRGAMWRRRSNWARFKSASETLECDGPRRAAPRRARVHATARRGCNDGPAAVSPNAGRVA